MGFIINPYSFGAASISYIVDDTSPDLAVSVRKISSTATNCIRIREDGGSTETDIGFSGDDLDTAAIASHCGANNGFIVKWYDQSGNGNDLVMSTAANQPQIYDGSVTITDPSNGQPAILFDGGNDRLDLTTPLLPNATATQYSVFQRSAAGQASISFAGNQVNWPYSAMWWTTNTRQYRPTNGTNSSHGTSTGTGDFMWWLEYSSNTSELYEQGVSLGTSTHTFGTNTRNWEYFGMYYVTGHDDHHQEAVLWNGTDASGDRAAVHTNVNDYYSIY